MPPVLNRSQAASPTTSPEGSPVHSPTKAIQPISPDVFHNQLRAAAKAIDLELARDNLPDLEDLLRRKCDDPGNSFLGPPARHDLTKSGYGGERSFKWPILDKDKNIPLPEVLFEQYDCRLEEEGLTLVLQCRCFMGLFPEIGRAWITIDHRLFLWNYEDGQDFYIFEDQDQVIVSVGLVKPAPGVFIEQIEYLLVLATPLEIILLGLAFNTGLNPNEPIYKREMTLYNTNMSVPADNVSMTSIVGSEKGRIFMTGNNGHLYELLYQAEEGWFTRKCRKLNHTSSAVSYFVPTFLKFSQDDPIIKIAVDESRHVLYTLSDKSAIEAIYLGPDGHRFQKIAKLTDIISPTQKALEQYPYSGYMDPNTFKICSISVVSPQESSHITLVAITSTGMFGINDSYLGCRLYLSCYPNYRAYGGFQSERQHHVSPSTLRLVFVRPPPSNYAPDRGMGGAGVGANQMNVSLYSRGILAGAFPISEEVDCVMGIAPDMGSLMQESWCEMFSSIYIDGKTWAIAEVPLKISEQQGVAMNEFHSQFSLPIRKFLILTNSGVTVLSKRRPIDVLQQLIMESHAQVTPILRVFFESVGLDQACAMCLAIACGHPLMAVKPLTAGTVSNSLVSGARKLFFELGGKPIMKETPRIYDVGAMETMGPLGMPLASPDIYYSGRYSGLALYMSRLVYPIWKKKVAVKATGNRSNDKLESAVDIKTLISIQKNLDALHHFLGLTPHFTAPPHPSDMDGSRRGAQNKQEEAAMQAEQEALHHLHVLLKQLLEAISLVLLLIDHNFGHIIQSIPPTTLSSIAELTFESLVTTSSGRELGKIMIHSLVNKQIGDQINVDVISESLREKCPSFCSPDDVVLYKGFESLQKAKSVSSAYERNNYLSESLRLFTLVADRLTGEKVEEICENYKNLRYHAGAVELVLLYAQKVDPAGYALGYYNSGQYSTVQDARSDAYQKRRHCYFIVFDVILSIDETLLTPPTAGLKPITTLEELEAFRRSVFEVALNSDDELFHYNFYEWLIENGFHDQLLQIRTPFLETYLQKEKHELEKADLLWQFYGKSGKYNKAARILADLADSEEYPIDLNKRIEYLSRAVANAKSSTSGSRTDNGQLLHDLEERIEVAQVQREVLGHVYNLVEGENYVHELNARLLTISELYNQFARPLQLHEVVLLILHTADHKDRPLIENTWTSIIKSVQESALGSGRRPFDALSDKLKEMGSRFYPDENTFPIRFLCGYLEGLTLQQHEQSDIGWVIMTMRAVGVSHYVLFQIYNDMFETKLAPWQGTENVSFLMQEICYLLHDWFDHIQQLTTPASERESFPVKWVDEAISKYLVTRLPNDTYGIISNLQTLQSRLRRRFA